MSFKPFIAIGHGTQTDGTWDTGCTYGNDTEAEMAKQIVGYILEVFDANNKNYLTDYPNNDKNITRDVEWANSEGCSHYISIHLDWDQAPSGIYPIYYPGSATGQLLAEAIRASMKLRIPGLNDRGNLQRDDYEVSNTNMPALIMEVGSIKADNALIKNNYRLFGHAIAYGIMDAAGETYHGVGENTPAATVPESTQPAATPATNNYEWDTTDVQYFLNICNYGAPDIDGIWGSETDQCLRNAQAAYQIEVDGLWGPITQAKAEEQIKTYQQKLNEKGIPTDVDGIAGPATYNSVKAFQGQNGLDMDGIVGPLTFAKLFDTNPPAQATNTDETPIVNFTEDEFKCECGCGGDVQHILKVKVQQLRNLLSQRAGHDMPLVITSGFRCPSQNAAVGGVPNSLHMEGAACDLYTPGMSDAMINEIAYCAKAVGLGVLRYYSSQFCHVQLYMTDQVMD